MASVDNVFGEPIKHRRLRGYAEHLQCEIMRRRNADCLVTEKIEKFVKQIIETEIKDKISDDIKRADRKKKREALS